MNRDHIKKGDVVYVPFPYSDKEPNGEEGEDYKDRPAIVIFSSGENVICCAVTKQNHRANLIPLRGRDLASGKIDNDPSYIKPDIISTFNKNQIRRKAASLRPERLKEVTDKVKEMIDQEPIEAPVLQAVARPKKRF